MKKLLMDYYHYYISCALSKALTMVNSINSVFFLFPGLSSIVLKLKHPDLVLSLV
jgi:hypothetical protein